MKPTLSKFPNVPLSQPMGRGCRVTSGEKASLARMCVLTTSEASCCLTSLILTRSRAFHESELVLDGSHNSCSSEFAGNSRNLSQELWSRRRFSRQTGAYKASCVFPCRFFILRMRCWNPFYKSPSQLHGKLQNESRRQRDDQARHARSNGNYAGFSSPYDDI